MHGDKSPLVEAMFRKLTEAGDTRLRNVSLGEPDASVMAELLAALPGVSLGSSIRYLAPGRSGAKVVVLINPDSLPLVVKLGKAEDIERETKNYHDSFVEERIPQEMRPALRQSGRVGDYAALVYSWAGGWEQVQSFREFFRTANEGTITRLLLHVMTRLFPWHRSRKSPPLPFDLWKWDNAVWTHLKESLDAWPGTPETKERLIAALSNPHRWRDALLTKQGGIGTCHGDLNCHNILISKADALPKLIDFASVFLEDCPARDWAKLERDIKLRCLRDLVEVPGEYITALAQVDTACASETVPSNSSVAVRKTAGAIITLRNQFRQLSTNLSDIPSVEYLYFLLCWTLAYLNNQEGLAEPPEVRNAIIESAVQTLELLEAEVNRISGVAQPQINDAAGDTHAPASAMPDFDEALKELASKFVSQLRIAGYIEDEEQLRHAVYLDEGLYVHRSRVEDAIADFMCEKSDSTSDTGKWLSIVGDAGHGKSSLLWYVFTELSANAALIVVPFMAQVEKDLGALVETVSRLKHDSGPSRTLVVLIDTLDIVVGLDDQALAAKLNSLKALGALVITTSRKQEADKLARFVASNLQVELRRYNDAEAQQAIRNQVRAYYHRQTEADQEQQFDRIWGLLEQQRDVRELDLEPLILRMLFEAYVPAEIPGDVNTQEVYRQYWHQRVLYDRVVKTAEERFDREQLCRFIAREIAFSEGHSDKFLLGPALATAKTGLTGSLPETIENLVSSGVLQWAEGRSSVRFFHQTFLEFTAAYDLLSSDSQTLTTRIESLLNDVANFNFFRAPILKQLAIQSYDVDLTLHLELMQSLRDVNNELAAQLALEIVGKIPESKAAFDICRRWIDEDPDILQGVVCETVRHYPKPKTAIALSFLQPFLSTGKETAIYSLCIDTFAKTDAEMVYTFLHPRLSAVVKADDDRKSYYKNALLAVATYGESRALDELLALLPRVKPGLQGMILHGIAQITTEMNATHVDQIVRSVSDLLPRLATKSRTDVFDALCSLISALHQVAPETALARARWLLETEVWHRDVASALFVGRIAAQTGAYAASVESSIAELRSPDHLIRMFNTGFLANLPVERSQQIMSLVLNVDRDLYGGVDTVRSLFTIVGHLQGVECEQVLQFLEQSRWPDSGIGTALALIAKHLAAVDPLAAKIWFLNRLRQSNEIPRKIKIIRALTILVQERSDIFERAELKEICETAFAAKKAGQQVFASAIGSVATVDTELAGQIFNRLFDEAGKDCQIVAINSLSRSIQPQPLFTLSLGRRVLNTSLQQHDPGLLDNYLVILKSLPRTHSREALSYLEEWFTESVFANIRHTKILSELLAVLKITAETDPALAFQISQRIPIVNKGIAGGLAALYDNVSEHSDDSDLLGEVLEAVGKISSFNQLRMGNALRRTLPRLGQKLGSARVIEMVMRVYKNIKDEQPLRLLLKAALEIPGWGATENAELLKDKDLPGAVRSLLSMRAR